MCEDHESASVPAKQTDGRTDRQILEIMRTGEAGVATKFNRDAFKWTKKTLE